MIVIPSIILSEGKVVVLTEGELTTKRVVHEDPIALAKSFQDAGARRIHIMDLEGVQAKSVQQWDAIAAIKAGVRTPLQVGGGVNTVEDAVRLAGLGVEHIVTGKLIFQNPDVTFVLRGEGILNRIMGAVTVKGAELAATGWHRYEGGSLYQQIDKLTARGVEEFILTDADRDGKLEGPNLDFINQAVQVHGPWVYVACGVTTAADVETLRDYALNGIIIGRALYDGKIQLEDALAFQRL